MLVSSATWQLRYELTYLPGTWCRTTLCLSVRLSVRGTCTSIRTRELRQCTATGSDLSAGVERRTAVSVERCPVGRSSRKKEKST